jgi:hypothetical protein
MEPLRLPARGLVLTPTPLARQPLSWVVLLHGFPQNCACWTWVLATLAAARSRYPCPGPRRARCRPCWPGTERPGGSACGPPVQVPTLNVSVRVIRRWGEGGGDKNRKGGGGGRLPPPPPPTTGRWVTGAHRFEVLAGAGQMIPSKLATRAWSSEWPDTGPRPGQILPAGAAVTVMIGSRGRTACTRQMLRFRTRPSSPSSTRPRHPLCPRKGRGRNQAGSEPGGDPPKPPGAASPRTEHGSRREEPPPPRARRETGAAVPGFADRTLFPGGCSVLSS